jgi:intein/homing endonuclease
MILDYLRYKKTNFNGGDIFEEIMPRGENNLMEIPEQFISPYRIDSRDMCLSASNQLESPHCFPKGMMVLMEDGTYKDIKDISYGEYVISGEGFSRKVNEKITRCWQGNTFHLKIKGLYKPIETTPEHPFWVKTRKYKCGLISPNPPSWVKAKDIKKGDFVLIMDSKEKIDKTIYSIEKDADFLWLLGLYIGDGWVRKESNEISIAINLRDIDSIVAKTVNIIEKLFNKTAHIDIKKENHLAIIRVSDFRMATLLKELGGEIHDKKSINCRLMTLCPSLQLNLFKGWVSADGWKTKNKKSQNGVTTSIVLAFQMRQILTRCGFKSSLTKRNQKDRKTCYTVSIYGSSYDNFMINNILDSEIWVAVENTSKDVHSRTVYNLSVDVDETYIVEGIKTHNCAGYSMAGYIEYHNWKTIHYPAQVDGDAIYAEAKKIDGNNSPGTYLRSAIQAAINLKLINGTPKYVDYPSINQSGMDRALKRIISIKFALHQYGVVLAGFRITDEWDWVDKKTGMIRDMGEKAKGKGGHAVLLCGYDMEGVYIQNSWGIFWGHYGFAVLSWKQYVQQIMQAMVVEN